MKEHGILMSGPMVRAYLAGLKTQTRRTRGLDLINENPDAWKFHRLKLREDGSTQAVFERPIRTTLSETKWVKMPYGLAGDRLWFKETHAIICREAIPTCPCETEEDEARNHYVEYRADTTNRYPGDWPEEEAKGNDEAPKWKPSIFMKRKYARIVTPIVSVRVERLHSITPADVLAEGIVRSEDGSWLGPLDGVKDFPYAHAHEAYFALWDHINGKTLPAKRNPWVWVYEFKPKDWERNFPWEEQIQPLVKGDNHVESV